MEKSEKWLHTVLKPVCRVYGKWTHCSVWVRWAFCGLLVGAVVSVSLPRRYESRVFTAPESTLGHDGGSDFGDEDVSDVLPGATGATTYRDAIIPTRYPLVAGSTSFLVGLFDVPLQPSFCPPDSTITLYEYMSKYQRRPWWTFVRAGISKTIGLLTAPFRAASEPDLADETPSSSLSGSLPSEGVVRISRKDAAIAAAIKGLISFDIDKKKRTVAIIATTQDPRVSSTLADTLSRRLQAYVTEYRTRKVNLHLEQAEALHRQAQVDYYAAQEEYARFADSNRNLSGKNNQRELVNLQVEKQMAYKNYVNTALQLQRARIMAYKKRPVFVIIEPAITPLSPSSPSVLKVMSVCCLLFLAIGYGWLWIKNHIIWQ